MKIYSVICSLYEELFRQTSLNRNYKFIPNDRDRKIIISFIKWLYSKYHRSEIGVDFLTTYFEFQFSNYVGMKTKFNKAIMLNWIVGNKAIQRWEERNPRLKWVVKVKINKEFSLKLKEAFKKENKSKTLNEKELFIKNVNQNEEKSKKQFYNTLKGFLYCQAHTTLFNKKSELCCQCENRLLCKDMLKNELPKFYKIRETEDE